MALDIPKFVTHYYRRSRRPFLNLSDLDDDSAMEVMRGLLDERRRPFGAKYLQMRRAAEARLREMFMARGGQPQRECPHYFVLGESASFRGLALDMEDVRIPIDELPSDQTTVTWGDSFSITYVSRDFGLEHVDQDYDGQLFGVSDIPALAGRYGLHEGMIESADDLATGRAPEMFVEVQLWSDDPVRSYLPFTT